MPGYLVVTQTVNDLEKYMGEYLPQAMPLLQKHGIEVVVAHFNGEAAEGSGNCALVLKGPSTDAVTAFLNDPEYAAPKALRHSISSGATVMVAPNFTPPS